MPTISGYTFGYGYLSYGAAIPLALAGLILALALWRRWPQWVAVLSGMAVIWSIVVLFLINVSWGINRPMAIPTGRFLASGSGRVLDVGAGSGRAAVGVLVARPQTTVTGLDIYRGFMGVVDNTPERFMTNARIAGAADRADTRTADMREIPFPDASFDAVVSSYAVDHLGGDGRRKALSEIARVLKPHGEFLLMIVNVDWWMWFVSPPMAHHPRVDAERWRNELGQAGFVAEEEGTVPVTRYWLARKRDTADHQLPTPGITP